MMAMCTENGLDIYNGDGSAKGIRMSLDLFKNKEEADSALYLYGYGDGGGGVTKEMLELLTRADKVPMTPKIELGNVQQYFEKIEGEEYPVWSGDLYFEKHRGTYTTAANNKKNNRKNEFLYRDAEIFSVFQYLENGKYDDNDLTDGWKLLLLNQFHDILPGTSITEVYEKSSQQYEQIRSIGERSISDNISKMTAESQNEKAITVYNTLSWSRNQVVEVKAEGHRGIVKEDGTYPKQVLKEDGNLLFLAEDVPAMGYQVYYLTDTAAETESFDNVLVQETESGYQIQTPFLQVEVSKNGEISSIYDVVNKREVLKNGRNGNVLKLLEDNPVEWGAAWETTTKKDDKPSLKATEITCEIKEQNSIYTVVETKRRMHQSTISQEMIFYHHKPLIEFKTAVDWNEHHKMLRVEFPVNVHTQTAKADIAFGNTEYPTHTTTSYDEARFEVCGHKWGDVSEDGYGTALLNDCKYGYSFKNSNMELSLLRSSDYPGDSCDRGNHTFTYWFYPHVGGIQEGKVAQTGYEVNVPLNVVKGKPAADSRTYFSVDSSSVVLDTIKKAEDGEDIILRFFETYNKTEQVKLTFDFPVKKCFETDLLEQNEGEMQIEDNSVSFSVNPYEIKTFRIQI